MTSPAQRFLPAFAGLVLLLAGQGGRAEEAEATSRTVRGVVELFTSQGCISCPPADRVLTHLAEDPGIVALAFHVDYWDYIGWQDPFGSAANTERQRSYAKSFNTGTIYTPQAVVNGLRDVVGSRPEAVAAALKETALTRQPAATVSLALQGDRLHIGADAEASAAPAPVLMLVTFATTSRTEIIRGENAGSTAVNTHAVRDWRVLGMWMGKPLSIDIPVGSLKASAGNVSTGCAAILQSVTAAGGPGPILAAAALDACG